MNQIPPNIVNRKLAAITPVLFCEITFCCSSVKHIRDIFTREALLYEIRKIPNLKSVTPDLIKLIAKNYDENVVITESTCDDFSDSSEGIFVSFRILLGRKKNVECFEVVIFDKKNKTATFFAVQEYDTDILATLFPYHIELTLEGNLRITLNSFEDADTSSAEWLSDKLFSKLMKWTENKTNPENIITSLSLVAADEYYNLYNDLKSKYSKQLVEMWPEKAKTDPKKYVFEDLAIATYLICLWRQLQTEDINFVDCGCGNGLLVYILNQEGYRGCGLDIRSRKTWELFPVQLKVEAVTPFSIFPNATWIIGNHSDELTPWIPVIASRSSPKTSYFVLPCCSYDFSGRKIRKSSEPVRNCTQLDRNLIARIVNIVVKNLLIEQNFINKPANRQPWNQGGKLTLQEITQKIPKGDLKLLKNECGGLQTLMKNHRYIFELKEGFVSLRAPLSLVECKKYQNKPCWYCKNHPDGCFFDDETCAYKH
ncbi:tRNA (uracil-O(2)-)-methyltransferase [Asbolus verrucosus]|uniref:tRNA (uracil-O(2)-)-methyltransferase n=1 Tax=Asbolus verrucosus TaxID=1661398 RepID=A0A482VER0_ASBVE|nr:tRNA (uracil-O(2)-)-methyltransferase [Asbolus verrucosus]